MLVKDLMSSPVVSLLVDQTVPLACEIMAFKHIRHLPVVDARNHLVGLVTHRDLVRWTDLAAELRREGRDAVRVEDMMTRDIYTAYPWMRASVVGRKMLECKYGCAPVIDEHDRLVGIVTDSDFLRVALDAIEAPVARFVNPPVA